VGTWGAQKYPLSVMSGMRRNEETKMPKKNKKQNMNSKAKMNQMEN
jgi:hypothetical protein